MVSPRRAGALAVVPKLAFIALSSIAQLSSVVSTSLAALLAALPYDRSEGALKELSDAAILRRYVNVAAQNGRPTLCDYRTQSRPSTPPGRRCLPQSRPP